MTRQYQIAQEEVLTAWKETKQSGGAAGYDRISIADIESDLKNQLYKVWNRLSSGSYMAQMVLQVDIPKAKGGVRTLGIPTVVDRVAQNVIKNRLEPLFEPHFHENSYAYRPKRSAIDAVGIARERCFIYKWALEIDISKFFDTLDHELLVSMVEKVYARTDGIIIH